VASDGAVLGSGDLHGLETDVSDQNIPDEKRLTLERPKSRKSVDFEIESGDLCITLSGGDLDHDAVTYLDQNEGMQLLKLLTTWLKA
jgi:hypothetical protein